MEKIKSFSWEIVSENIAIKYCDRSVILYSSSGIPSDISCFFDADNMCRGEKKQINIIIGAEKYDAHISRDESSSGRLKIAWKQELTKVIAKRQLEDKHADLILCFVKASETDYELLLLRDINEIPFQDELESVVINNHKDGARKEIYTTIYERNVLNRKAAINLHGTVCAACGFDFEKAYGELGKGFIEVHHVKPLSEIDQEVVIDPKHDLVCLCSNCHKMIHRRRNILTVEELKAIIKTKK